jgi:hypothetical protein
MLRLIAQYERDIDFAKSIGRGASLGATYSQLARMKEQAAKAGILVERRA